MGATEAHQLEEAAKEYAAQHTISGKRTCCAGCGAKFDSTELECEHDLCWDCYKAHQG